MRFRPAILLGVILLACFMPAGFVHAQEAEPGVATLPPDNAAEIKELADQFYIRCRNNPAPTLTIDQQEEHCVCLSAQIYRKTLLPEERRYLAYGSGTMDKRRLVTQVYGQCIGVPGRATMLHACTHSPKGPKLAKGNKALDAMCLCLQKEMGFFWDTMAPAYFEMPMTEKMNFDDPVKVVLNSPFYRKSLAKNRSKCVSIYGRRD